MNDSPLPMRADFLTGEAWIDGHARHGPRRFGVHNPADGSLLAQVVDCGAAEAQAAAEAACRSLASWRSRPAKDRSSLLRAWHGAVLRHQHDLAQLIALEQGKPLAEARAEVAYGASYIEWFAEQAKRAGGEVIPENLPGRKLLAVKEAVGVVAAITPWNFPLAMLARKAAPALAAGCTVVAKPSEEAPLTALALARLAQEAGLPDGVLNVLPASRQRAAEVVDVWLADARVRKLSFTGSTAVGQHLARECASTLKRVSMELGGNAPFIVFDDADLDAAVAGALSAKFRNTGQTCVCANRLLVQAGVYEAFADKLGRAVAALRSGPALAGNNELGPLINGAALAKVQSHVDDALAQGARLLAGGRPHALGGLFFEPTVLRDATPRMRIAQEETFGPVAALMRFDTEAEAIAMANDTPFGLAAYFYARDIGRVWRVAQALEVGMVGINEGLISTELAPFGGIKASGYGREGSEHGLDDYQSLKYLCMGGLGT
jgi:succinate-semialdehyde dehydrogenase/glutarate-semialdehyde dehydrogenase